MPDVTPRELLWLELKAELRILLRERQRIAARIEELERVLQCQP